MGQRFPRSARLRHRKDFSRIILKGKKITGDYFDIFFDPSESGGGRLGLIVSKKTGPSVVRNRIKRRLREIFRISRDQMKQNPDIIIRTKPACAEVAYQILEEEFRKVLNQASLRSDFREKPFLKA